MPSTLAPDRLGVSSRRVPSRGARPPGKGEVTLSQELRTAGLLRPHVLVGSGGHTSGCVLVVSPVTTDTSVVSCHSPHRSGLAHHAHPVPHLMNSRPARSVVGTWTWFRSRCTCQVSLQRLRRRHPLPLTGFLGLVPPLQRYSEVLRLPAAHFAALRFLRWAIPSLRPLFVPPGPGRGAVDQSGVGRRYLQPPGSIETAGSPKFPGNPRDHSPCSPTPVGPGRLSRQWVSCLARPPRLTRTRAHHEEISGLNRTAFDLAVYAS